MSCQCTGTLTLTTPLMLPYPLCQSKICYDFESNVPGHRMMRNVKRSTFRDATKQETAQKELVALAHQIGPGAKLPTFRNLLTDLEVSRTTLATVLNLLEEQGVITRRHGIGIYVSSQLARRNIVLLCATELFHGEGTTPFWNMLVQHARARVAAKSEDFALHFTRSDGPAYNFVSPSLSEPLIAEVAAGRVHGILGVGLNMATYRWIEAHDVPYVAFAGYGACFVAFDSVASVQMGVGELAARGCRRIALWSSVSPHHPVCRAQVLSNPTLGAFQEALKAHALAFDPGLVRTQVHLCPDDPADCCGEWSIPSLQEQGRDVTNEVFGRASDLRLRPDGIVCTDDCLMQGALPQLVRSGLRIGIDVQIATHANAGSSSLYGYEDLLIRMEADPGLLVREMYARLEAQMDGGMPPTPQLYLPPTLRLPPNGSP